MKDAYKNVIKNDLGHNLKLEDLVSSPIILLKSDRVDMKYKGIVLKHLEFFNKAGGRILSFKDENVRFIHDDNYKGIYPRVNSRSKAPLSYLKKDIDTNSCLYLGLSDEVYFYKNNRKSVLNLFAKRMIENTNGSEFVFYDKISLSSNYVTGVFDNIGMMIWPKSLYD